MAKLSDYYPPASDDCFSVGMAGRCGLDCQVYLRGDCNEPQEMIPGLKNLDDLADYEELYGPVDFAIVVAITSKERE